MNPTLEILTLERDRLRTQYTAQISLLDSIICRLETYAPTEPSPQPPPVPDTPAPPPQPAPVPRPLRLAPKTKHKHAAAADPTPNPHRRSPAGSKSILIRRAILDRSGPVTAAEVAEATGLPKSTVSGCMSACVAREELALAGLLNGRQLYRPTDKFQRPNAQTGAKAQPGANGETAELEKDYKAFRAGLSIKVPEIKLGFTEREEP